MNSKSLHRAMNKFFTIIIDIFVVVIVTHLFYIKVNSREKYYARAFVYNPIISFFFVCGVVFLSILIEV